MRPINLNLLVVCTYRHPLTIATLELLSQAIA